MWNSFGLKMFGLIRYTCSKFNYKPKQIKILILLVRLAYKHYTQKSMVLILGKFKDSLEGIGEEKGEGETEREKRKNDDID